MEKAFHAPDWSAPLNVEALLAEVPPHAKNKGILLRTAVREATAHAGAPPPWPPYSPLQDYPVQEHIRVVTDCARIVYPALSLRQGVRRLGQLVFSGVQETAAGAFLFSIAGRNPMAAFRLITRGYALFSCARADVTTISDRELIVELRNAWVFPDAYNVGIIEGGMGHYDQPGQILIRKHSPCDVDVKIILP